MLHTRHETGCFFGSIYGHQRIGPKYSHARKKTAGYHLFRNVLPECHSILGSQLTAAASYSAAMFGRGGLRALLLHPCDRAAGDRNRPGAMERVLAVIALRPRPNTPYRYAQMRY